MFSTADNPRCREGRDVAVTKGARGKAEEGPEGGNTRADHGHGWFEGGPDASIDPVP